MIEQKDVTIIIPHLGDNKQQCFALRECRNTLQRYSPEIRVLIVKNGTVPCICWKDITILEQGQCKAVNAAVATTNTPWIMVSNDDMIYCPNWFENLTSNIDYEGHLCISPKLIEPMGGAPTFERFFAGGAGGDFDMDKWLMFAIDYQLRSEEEKKLRTGFNLPFLIDRELWDIVGGYDINYDPWSSNSDSDLEYAIRIAGVQPMQNQRSIVYHFSQTSGTFEPKNRPAWEKNWQYFIDKWGFARTDDGIWQANFVIPSEEEGRTFNPWWEDLFIKQKPMFQAESEAE